jgi:hypothetical protein
MTLPEVDAENQKKPLCYDPSRARFIYYQDIVSGKAEIVPVETLSEADFAKLVLERLRVGPDFTVQAMSGPPMSRDDVVRAVQRGEEFGRMTVDAERSYLREVLARIRQDKK